MIPVLLETPEESEPPATVMQAFSRFQTEIQKVREGVNTVASQVGVLSEGHRNVVTQMLQLGAAMTQVSEVQATAANSRAQEVQELRDLFQNSDATVQEKITAWERKGDIGKKDVMKMREECDGYKGMMQRLDESMSELHLKVQQLQASMQGKQDSAEAYDIGTPGPKQEGAEASADPMQSSKRDPWIGGGAASAGSDGSSDPELKKDIVDRKDFQKRVSKFSNEKGEDEFKAWMFDVRKFAKQDVVFLNFL